MTASTRPCLDERGLSSSCIEVLRHLWDYLDEELTPAGAERLRAHIATCSTCKQYEGFQTCFLEAMTRLKAQFSAPSTLREKLAEKLKSEGCGCWSRAKK